MGIKEEKLLTLREHRIGGVLKALPGMVAHAYNPGYSGGRDQEDCVSKPAQANSL
jgi:hypothetical protein